MNERDRATRAQTLLSDIFLGEVLEVLRAEALEELINIDPGDTNGVIRCQSDAKIRERVEDTLQGYIDALPSED